MSDEPIDDGSLHDDKVSQAWRTQREAPSALLDAEILAAAERALADGAKANTAGPRRRRWLPAIAVAATMVLGLALSLQLMLQPEPIRSMEERDDAMAPAATSSKSIATGEVATDAAPVPIAPLSAASPAASPAAVFDQPKADVPLQSAGGTGAFQPSVAKLPASEPAPAPSTLRESELARMRESMAVDKAASLERVEVTGARIKRSDEDWLAAIAALRAAGKGAEADREQQAYCAANPDHAACQR